MNRMMQNGALAAVLALAGLAIGQAVPVAGARGGTGVQAAGGSQAAIGPGARLDVRALALGAFPEVRGFDRPKNIQPHRAGGGPRPRALDRTRPGWLSGFPPIPDLPQVKAEIARTNQVVSRAMAARNPSGTALNRDGSRGVAPGKLTPRRPEDHELARRLSDLRAGPGTDAARRVVAAAAVGASRPGDNRTGQFVGSRDQHLYTFAVTNRGPEPITDRGPLDPRLDSLTPGLYAGALADQLKAPPSAPGAAALAEGDLVSAATALIKHLDQHPDDAPATRRMALTILLHGQAEAAENAMLEAYRLDPALAANPVDRDNLPGDLRDLVIKAVNRANKTGTPQSWLLVGVLMQGQGRGDNAARMLARARAAGLDGAIADAFDAELARQ